MEPKKINWKVRFKNKIWLGSFIALIVSFVFTLLSMFDIYPKVTENVILQIVNQILEFMALIGVILDPTTEGLGDSKRALQYAEPWKDEPDDQDQDE